MFERLRTADDIMTLLDLDSSEFQNGAVATSVHTSRGLGLDQVIIPDIPDEPYHTPLGRGLLCIVYIRAMHQLDLTCCGRKTGFP